MAAKYTIMTYQDQPQAFLTALRVAKIQSTPSPTEFELESKYRGAIAGDSFRDVSFAVMRGEHVAGIVLCHKQADGLSYYGRGIQFFYDEPAKKLLNFVIETLSKLALEHDFHSFKVCDYAPGKELSPLGVSAYNAAGVPGVRFEALIDLRQSEEDIHKNLRQSYKALVNQGEREIDFKIINSDNANFEIFESFREFHKDVSGRVTRSAESWQAQFEMIEQGCAELIVGYMDGHGLVSSSLCLDHGNTTYYGVAVYDRDLFEKPLGHASVYESILRAKNRGQSYFSLGVIGQKGTVEKKEYNIGVFKKGFCDQLSCFLEWNVPI